MRKVVVNTTPLIALSHVGRLNILKELYGEIIIPEAVYKELSAKEDSICKNAVERSRGRYVRSADKGKERRLCG